VLSDPSMDGKVVASGLPDVAELNAEKGSDVESDSLADDMNDEELEDWEVELEESVQGTTSHICDWPDL